MKKLIFSSMLVLCVLLVIGCPPSPNAGNTANGPTVTPKMAPKVTGEVVNIEQLLTEFKSDIKQDIRQTSYALDKERADQQITIITMILLFAGGLALIALCVTPPERYRGIGIIVGIAVMVGAPLLVYWSS